ncbi:MAG: hypothetical protein ACU88J_06860 [Gammaproteobacteria bacterium]
MAHYGLPMVVGAITCLALGVFIVIVPMLCAHRYTLSVLKPVFPAGIAGIQATWMYLSSSPMPLDTRRKANIHPGRPE